MSKQSGKLTIVRVAPTVPTINEHLLASPLDNAPCALIRLYEHPNAFRNREILGRLLTDPRMKRGWNEIGKQLLKNPAIKRFDHDQKDIFMDEQYIRLWREINYAFLASYSRPPSRSKKHKTFLDLAESIETLASTIDNGPLDRLAFEFFPAEMAASIFNTTKWSNLESEKREQAVRKLKKKFVLWPSMTDLLRECSRRANALAQEALTEKRFAVNDTQDRQVSSFIQHFSLYLRTKLKRPMKGVLAPVASVVFEKPTAESYTTAFVKRALRHT